VRIGLVSYKKLSQSFSEKDANIALPSLAAILPDKKIYGMHEGLKETFSHTIFWGKKQGLSWLVANGKPKNWGKIIYQPSVPFEMYDAEHVELLYQVGFDGYLVPDIPHLDVYNIFGKPLIRYTTYYNFDNEAHLREIPKKRKVFLHIFNSNVPDMHAPHVLEIFRQLKKVEGITQVRNADSNIIGLANRMGIRKRLMIETRKKPRSEFLESLADCKVFISLDTRQMMGHSQLDAAAVGAYSVSPANPIQYKIFPNLIIDYRYLSSAVKLVNNLLDSADYKMSQIIKDMFSKDTVLNMVRKDLLNV